MARKWRAVEIWIQKVDDYLFRDRRSIQSHDDSSGQIETENNSIGYPIT